MQARSTEEGVHLGLQRFGVRVWWQGQSGMCWRQVLRTVQNMVKYEDPPKILVVHCGGNDIGTVPSADLRVKMLATIRVLGDLLPNTHIVWSQILPRLAWGRALGRVRLRVNNKVATELLKLGGGYIKHPEISATAEGLFIDGVHLSYLGNCLFLHGLQEGLSSFLHNGQKVYPDCGSRLTR